MAYWRWKDFYSPGSVLWVNLGASFQFHGQWFAGWRLWTLPGDYRYYRQFVVKPVQKVMVRCWNKRKVKRTHIWICDSLAATALVRLRWTAEYSIKVEQISLPRRVFCSTRPFRWMNLGLNVVGSRNGWCFFDAKMSAKRQKWCRSAMLKIQSWPRFCAFPRTSNEVRVLIPCMSWAQRLMASHIIACRKWRKQLIELTTWFDWPQKHSHWSRDKKLQEVPKSKVLLSCHPDCKIGPGVCQISEGDPLVI